MSDPIVSIRDLSKAYSIYRRPRDLVKEIMLGGVHHDVFWALKDVSLDVHEGQRVGIVGPNGAGKTTLLRLITGNLNPTSGTIDVHGRISAMLSLTSFLNPEETGLENIRFNLILNGARRSEIPRLTEEIVDFTELGAFIHAPVRTYSSGMNARLAFTISTVVSPDILVVDEVLGAGDAYFVGKATQRMIELCEQGRALLFVSHSISAVQLLCNTAIWMDGGVIRESGPVEQVVRRYEAEFRQHEDLAIRSGNRARDDRLASTVRPEELARPDVLRLRVTAKDGTFRDQHYVRRIVISLDGTPTEVGLDLASIDDEVVDACLDLLHSEWGRPHVRRGSDSRALGASSSRLRGGHVLVSIPTSAGLAEVGVEIESESLRGEERLAVEYVDPATGEWAALTARHEQLGDGWRHGTYSGTVELRPGVDRDAVLARVVESNRPDVEILDVAVYARGRDAISVAEHEPFEIAVRIHANRLVPVADVGIRIIRSDGVYVFWQSSGETAGNLREVFGEWLVRFIFQPNLLGAGEFEVTAYIANGFDPDRNYPYSEVFDRRVSALTFTVSRARREIDYGVVNQRVPVLVEKPGGEAEPRAAVPAARVQLEP